MKKILLFIFPTFLILWFPNYVSINKDPLAQSGCCMERDDLNNNNWYENGMNLRRCRDLNRRRDGDDLYDRAGYVYWDGNC